MLFSLLANSCAPSAEDIYQEGKAHYKNKEYDKALDCYIKAKEQGYDSAYSAIASLYYYGLGVKKNMKRRLSMLKLPTIKMQTGTIFLEKCTIMEMVLSKINSKRWNTSKKPPIKGI